MKGYSQLIKWIKQMVMTDISFIKLINWEVNYIKVINEIH